MDEIVEIALMCSAAVFHQVGLAVARRWFAPVNKSPYRNAMFDGRANTLTTAPPDGFLHWPQEPVEGRRADVQDRASHHRVEPQMPVAFDTLNQPRQQRLQPFAANPVGRPPQQPQSFTSRLAVDRLTWSCRP